jgi:hypothetical protein
MALSHVMNVISNAGIVSAGTGSGGGGGSGAIMSASMTAGYTSGYAYQSSGYYDFTSTTGSTLGTVSGNNLLGTVLGQTGVICTGVSTTNSVMYIRFQKTGFTGTFVNTGWTSVNIYLDQSNNTGSPDLTLARTALTFNATTGSGATATYSNAGSYSISSYFGTNGNEKDYFVEIL